MPYAESLPSWAPVHFSCGRHVLLAAVLSPGFDAQQATCYVSKAQSACPCGHVAAALKKGSSGGIDLLALPTFTVPFAVVPLEDSTSVCVCVRVRVHVHVYAYRFSIYYVCIYVYTKSKYIYKQHLSLYLYSYLCL